MRGPFYLGVGRQTSDLGLLVSADVRGPTSDARGVTGSVVDQARNEYTPEAR